MRTFKVLLHHGLRTPPSLHLVTVSAEGMAQEIADELLTETPGAVGVEVWADGKRLYARGATPARSSGEAGADPLGSGELRSPPERGDPEPDDLD